MLSAMCFVLVTSALWVPPARLGVNDGLKRRKMPTVPPADHHHKHREGRGTTTIKINYQEILLRINSTNNQQIS
jgi:hypothetical protein